MKIEISAPARAFEANSGVRIYEESDIMKLNGQVFENDCCYNYLDMQLVDLGIMYGIVRCSYSLENGLWIATDYWVRARLTADQVKELVDDTIGQWEDGIGESGFRFQIDERLIDVFFHCQRNEVIVRQFNDQRDVPSPSRVAICARDGNGPGLLAALDNGETVDGQLQGFTALHLAILYARVDTAQMLLDHGASVNLCDRNGNSPLHLCALSNSLSDDDSATLAEELLRQGANISARTPQGDLAIELAQSRNKDRLTNSLRAHN